MFPGRLWSNMLVFWLQKIVSVDSSGQSRVFSVGGRAWSWGARHLEEAGPGDIGG